MTKTFCIVLLLSGLLFPAPLRADEAVEKAGMGIGLTAGNLVVVPAKAVAVSVGMAAGLLSFIFTGGDMEVARQAWQNSTQGPYLVTPEVARTAIGDRPELKETGTPPDKY